MSDRDAYNNDVKKSCNEFLKISINDNQNKAINPCLCSNKKSNKLYYNIEEGTYKCQSNSCGLNKSEGNYHVLNKEFKFHTKTTKSKYFEPTFIYRDELELDIYGINRFLNKAGDKVVYPCLYINGQWEGISTKNKNYTKLSEQYKSIEKIPYNLDRIAKEKPSFLYIVEGEKCADRLNEILPEKHLATTNTGGASKNLESFINHIKKYKFKNIYILPDNDEEGSLHANSIYEMLKPLDNVYIITLSGIKKEKQDIADLIEFDRYNYKTLSQDIIKSILRYKPIEISEKKTNKKEHSFKTDFYKPHNSEGKENKNPINYTKFINEIERFFAKIEENEEYCFYKKTGQVLEKSNYEKIREFVNRNVRQSGKADLYEMISNPKFSGLNDSQINKILSIEVEQLKSEKQKSYIFYSNGFLEITKDSIVFRKYNELEKLYVYDIYFTKDNSKNNRKFNSELLKSNDFHFSDSEIYKLIRIMTNEITIYRNEKGEIEETENYIYNKSKAIMSALGYILHNHKDKSINYLVNFYDREYSDSADGGTGKSALAECVEYIRNTVRENAKLLDYKGNRFALQKADKYTQIVYLEDLPDNFNLTDFYNPLTNDRLEVEKKRKDSFFTLNPVKYIGNSNSPIKVRGDSDKRRLAQYPIHKNFKVDLTIQDYFNKNLYSDFNESDWLKFDLFASECIRIFLSEGVLTYEDDVASENRLLHNVGESFYHFAIIKINELARENEHRADQEFRLFKNKLCDEYNEKTKLNMFTKTFSSKLCKVLDHFGVSYKKTNDKGKSLNSQGDNYFLVKLPLPDSIKEAYSND